MATIVDPDHRAFLAALISVCWNTLRLGPAWLAKLNHRLVAGQGIREGRLCAIAFGEFAVAAQGSYAAGDISLADAKLAAQYAVTATEALRLDGIEKVQCLVFLARNVPLARSVVADRVFEWAAYEPKQSLDEITPLMRLGPKFREAVVQFSRELASAHPELELACEGLADAASSISPLIEIPLAQSNYARGRMFGEIEYAVEQEEADSDERVEEIVRVTVVEWLEERGDLRSLTRLVERAAEVRPAATWRGLRRATDCRAQRVETADLMASVQQRHPSCAVDEAGSWKHRGLEAPLPPPGETVERVWTFETGPSAGRITIGRPRGSSRRRLSLTQ